MTTCVDIVVRLPPKPPWLDYSSQLIFTQKLQVFFSRNPMDKIYRIRSSKAEVFPAILLFTMSNVIKETL